MRRASFAFTVKVSAVPMIHARLIFTYCALSGVLLDVPKPDFSMPFNVICLSSTVLVLLYSNLFNIIARTRRKDDKNPRKGLLARLKQKIKRLKQKIKDKLFCKRQNA